MVVGFSGVLGNRVQQVSKGYFHDYNSLRHSGGKTFMAPTTLIREDVSPSLPSSFPRDNSELERSNLYPPHCVTFG